MANDDVTTTTTKNSTSQPGMTLQGAPKLALKSDEMRKIVLDYLTHSAYVNTAIAFARESSSSQSSGSSSGAAGSAGLAASANGDDDMNEDADMQDEDDEVQDGDADATIRNDEHDGLRSSSSSSDNDIDTPMLRREDIRLIRIRREIMRLVQQGHIQQAIDLCNAHFPSVLTPPSSSSSSKASRTAAISTPSSSSASSSAATPRASFPSSSSAGLFNRNVSSSTSSKPSATSSLLHAFSSHISSSNPAISSLPILLSLSLQIQLFIEVVRSSANGFSESTISRPSTPYSQAHSPSSTNGTGSMENSTASLASNGSSQMSTTSVLSSTSTNGSTSAIQVALTHAQNLHAQASLLPDPGMRAAYLKELETVSGLLPYHDPRTSPVAYYLDESRRDVLANMVNGAILLSLGHSSTSSKLAQIVAQNQTVWRCLNELKATYPPEKGSAKDKAPRAILPFDMETFLNTATLPGQAL